MYVMLHNTIQIQVINIILLNFQIKLDLFNNYYTEGLVIGNMLSDQKGDFGAHLVLGGNRRLGNAAIDDIAKHESERGDSEANQHYHNYKKDLFA